MLRAEPPSHNAMRILDTAWRQEATSVGGKARFASARNLRRARRRVDTAMCQTTTGPTMKQSNNPPPSASPVTPRDQKQAPITTQTAPTHDREEVRKIAPPIHAPRQSQRPKERSK